MGSSSDNDKKISIDSQSNESTTTKENQFLIVLKNLSWQDFENIGKIPCARKSFLYGIGGGATVGSLRTSSRGNSVNNDAHQLSLQSLLESASAAVTSHTLLSNFDEDQVSLTFPFASSSHITSPSNSSSSFPTDELRSQTGGYHPRDEVDDYPQASDSDSDLRSPKRLRLEEITEIQPAMRINQGENGVGGSTNGVSLNSSNGDSQNATNGQALTDSRMQRTRQQELVRLMVQAMQDMGYSQSAATLEQESGFPLESSAVAKFRDGVLKGDWALVESLFPTLELDHNKDVVVVRFLIRQQKYLELLEARQIKKALIVLRNELTPLDFNLERLHSLSSNAEDLRRRAEWDGAKGTSRQKLLVEIQKYISPSIMVREHRLETLLEQATTLQRISCLYHNTNEYISLYSDHVCDRQHTDEVWYVAFSNNGRFLASASKDKTAIIWSLETWNLVHVLRDHMDCVSFLSWSPDDSKILTCGQDNVLKLWSVESGECLNTIKKHEEPVTACAWLPDGKRFISGSQDKNTYLWNLDGTIVHKWSGARIADLAINKEGTRMVAICHDNKLHIYDLETRKEEAIMDENAKLTSICLSSDCKYALLNLSTKEIHLWDIDERRIVRKYFGQKQGRFVIRSCFGGIDQGFIVSGSEDSKIYVWHREHADLIETLSGHKGSVNSVNWSPIDPYMFASAGDDKTIRIWGPPSSADHNGKMKTP
ncbi:10420_t:CDS:10 [Funneliformis caledonium]|uniref:Cytochrome c oxidase assembly protein COX20, mitochondrial n=1 Tax=Funneliformis caledonium TaxID=1117310 RepID=A0A9N9AAU9_9GLOM|nr:10420_t:CDS:10 [Funneliformis caledonium]